MDVVAERSLPTPYSNSPLLPLLLFALSLEKFIPNAKKRFKPEYDFIIVGAGSAGSVVANRLSELGNLNILLLEAGAGVPILSQLPAIPLSFIGGKTDWNLKTVPQKYAGKISKDRRMDVHIGKSFGGSSSLNLMYNVRGNRFDYDNWAALGAEGWSYEEVLPYFKNLENMRDPEYYNSKYHGFTGPITIERPVYTSEVQCALNHAAKELGYKFVDVNGKSQYGYYNYTGTTRKAKRCSTAKAYLVPAENKPNLDIVGNALVRKILFKDRTAIGVEVEFDGSIYQIKSKREVILSAGAVFTPQLLMLSGIGPKKHLQDLKIPLVRNLPVGRNFQDDMSTILAYELSDRIPSFSSKLENSQNILQYIESNTGPLSTLAGTATLGFSSKERTTSLGKPPINELVIFEQFPGDPAYTGKQPDTYQNKTTISCLVQAVRPRSRGYITLNSTNPHDPPNINPNYLSNAKDLRDTVDGLKNCRRLVQTQAMRRLEPKLIVAHDCRQYKDDEDKYLTCLVQYCGYSSSHQIGTARMGNPRDPTTVVDPLLRVKGVSKLRVVDASVMPQIVSGHTNVPTIMIAEKSSDIIKNSIRNL